VSRVPATAKPATLARLAAALVVIGCVAATPGVAGSEPATGANVNMVGEAFTVRQDGTVPTDLLLARYPRAATEVSDDLSTGFASFADPGFLLRFGIGSGLAASGRRDLTAPTWAECLYPRSPQTPTAETRAPGAGLGPEAVAECRARGSHLAGYATQAAPDGARAQHLRGGPLTATVDTTAAADGTTAVVSASEIDDVTIGGAVTLRSIRNRAEATTTGRPGGAKALAESTIGALLIDDHPVALPSDSIARLGPALAALGPVVAPVGTITFDVVPEAVQAAADGTQATARAAQLTVTLHTGQLTVAFGLGYARAGARTIVNEPLPGEDRPALGGGLGGLAPSSPEAGPTPEPDVGGSAPPAACCTDDRAAAASAALSPEPRPSPPPFVLPAPPVVTGPAVEPPPASSPVLPATAPALPAAAPATAVARRPGGASKETVALLGVVCAVALVRYLSYSATFRRL